MRIRIRYIFLIVLVFMSNVPLSHSMPLDLGEFTAGVRIYQHDLLVSPEPGPVTDSSPPVFMEAVPYGGGSVYATALAYNEGSSAYCSTSYRYLYYDVGNDANAWTDSSYHFTAMTDTIHLNLEYYLFVFAEAVPDPFPPYGPPNADARAGVKLSLTDAMTNAIVYEFSDVDIAHSSGEVVSSSQAYEIDEDLAITYGNRYDLAIRTESYSFPAAGGNVHAVAALAAFNLNAVPEPGTMLLLGTGLIGLAVIGRKRFKNNRA